MSARRHWLHPPKTVILPRAPRAGRAWQQLPLEEGFACSGAQIRSLVEYLGCWIRAGSVEDEVAEISDKVSERVAWICSMSIGPQYDSHTQVSTPRHDAPLA